MLAALDDPGLPQAPTMRRTWAHRCFTGGRSPRVVAFGGVSAPGAFGSPPRFRCRPPRWPHRRIQHGREFSRWPLARAMRCRCPPERRWPRFAHQDVVPQVRASMKPAGFSQLGARAIARRGGPKAAVGDVFGHAAVEQETPP